MKNSYAPYFVVIDLGSTSFHMLIAKKENNQLKPIKKLKRPIHLAAGLDKNNFLNKQSICAGIDCLHYFKQELKTINHPIEQIRIVATHTFRVAKNINLFLEQAEQIFFQKIEIISSYEEGRLIYIANNLVFPEKTKRLIIDIGGGSTEICFGIKENPLIINSIETGCVTLTNLFFPDYKIDQTNFMAAKHFVQNKFNLISEKYKKQTNFHLVLGSSGTFRAIYHELKERNFNVESIKKEFIFDLMKEILKTGDFFKLNYKSMTKKRRLVFPAGLIILIAIIDELKLKEIQICKNGVREGVLSEMQMDPKKNQALTEVHQICFQYIINKKMSKKINSDWMQFISKNSELNKKVKNPHLRKVLYYSSYLFNVGSFINQQGRQKHSEYILKNTKFYQLNSDEQNLLVHFCRLHRKNIKDLSFEFPDFCDEDLFFHLLLLFRFTILLNLSRQMEDNLDKIQITRNANNFVIFLPKNLIEYHSYLHESLKKEINYWNETQKFHLKFNFIED